MEVSEEQFSFSRVEVITGGRAKSEFLLPAVIRAMKANQCHDVGVSSPISKPQHSSFFQRHLGNRNSFEWVLCLSLLVVLPTPVEAQFDYTTDTSTITIVKYTGPGGAVTIPSTIDLLPVTTIGDRAFYGCAGLTSVIIPDSVGYIGVDAFSYCTNLTSVTIPQSIENRYYNWEFNWDEVFSYCTNLKSIMVDPLDPVYCSVDGVLFDKEKTQLIKYPMGKAGSYIIPNSVTRIGDMAFTSCDSLTGITIPNSITNILSIPFTSSSHLKSITVDASNPVYSSVDGVLFSKHIEVLIEYPPGKAGSYTVPSSVTYIGGEAFRSCARLTSIKVPDGVWGIGLHTFLGCSNLTAVTLPNTVATIGNGAFFSCTSLTNFVIPNKVTSIKSDTFAKCTNLITVTVPSSVTSIDYRAFRFCEGLRSIYFQGNAPRLNDYGVSGLEGASYNVTIYYLSRTTGWGTTFGGRKASMWTTLVILQQPQSQDGVIGKAVVFDVLGYGSTTLKYQWRKDGMNVVNSSRISGATNSSLTISNLTQADAGNYSVVVSLVYGTGSITSAPVALLTRASIPPSLSITSHSDGQVVSINTITVSGTASDAALGDNGIISVTVNNVRAANDTALGAGVANWHRTVTLANANGPNVLIVVATDGKNSSTTNKITMFCDTAPPLVVITKPTANISTNRVSYTLSGTATDSFGVRGVWYQFNSNGWQPAQGVNSWEVPLLLVQRTNLFEVFALDLAGNVSLTQRVNLLYVMTNRLELAGIGQGTLSPNYSNAVLEIGKSYSIKASGINGYAFSNWVVSTNWVGGVNSNNPTLNFFMQSNLTLQANFVDTNKPTISITNLISGQRLSNAVFTVKGTAKDNVGVTAVFCLTNGIWGLATTTKNWTNWAVDVALVPGTNVLKAYSLDATGNKSPTNSVSMIYVLADRLQVQTSGQGTLSPNYSNAVLEIGKSYSIKASGINGYAFSNWVVSTNWVGGVNSNNPTLNFFMQSNLTLQANFVDTNKPTISITNLISGQRLSNAVFTVKGKASDNARVAAVSIQLNGELWTNATGTTNWTAVLNLGPGTNVVRAYASDGAGNISLTNTLNFQYVVTNQLQLAITGKGTVSPNYSNGWLEIGRAYTVTATPASGFMFTNWTGGTSLPLSVVTNKPGLRFIMQSNLMLVANLLDTNRPTLTILNPANNQRLGGNNVTIVGKATDNWRVTNAWYQVNSNGWQTVNTTNSYTNWTVMVSLNPGTNTLMAFAQDLGGNYSLTNSIRVVATNVVTLKLMVGAPNTPRLQLRTEGWQETTKEGFAFGLEISTNVDGHIEYSTDLLNWVPLARFNGTNSTIKLHDPAATNGGQRFYRAVTP